jgi:Arc/MetJ-type ribon-helix-helix transcriptional regulator
MVVSLKPEIERLVEEKVSSGLFPSADELVNAAVEQFMSTVHDGDDDFAPGRVGRFAGRR